MKTFQGLYFALVIFLLHYNQTVAFYRSNFDSLNVRKGFLNDHIIQSNVFKYPISRKSGKAISLIYASSKSPENIQFSKPSGSKGRILILGGSGFLGQAVARRAILEGYKVVSISRRGKPPKIDENLIGIQYIAVSSPFHFFSFPKHTAFVY